MLGGKTACKAVKMISCLRALLHIFLNSTEIIKVKKTVNGSLPMKAHVIRI